MCGLSGIWGMRYLPPIRSLKSRFGKQIVIRTTGGVGGRCPPLGGASIASGYTSAALAGGRAPGTPRSTQAPYHSPCRQRQGPLITLCLLSKRDPLRWALVWARENRKEKHAEEKNSHHHRKDDTANKGRDPTPGQTSRDDNHRLPGHLAPWARRSSRYTVWTRSCLN